MDGVYAEIVRNDFSVLVTDNCKLPTANYSFNV